MLGSSHSGSNGSGAHASSRVTETCPHNCSSLLLASVGVIPDLGAPTTAQCVVSKVVWPMLLGTDLYSCCWGWVWQNLAVEVCMH